MDGYLFKWVNKSIAKKSKLESGGKRERERIYPHKCTNYNKNSNQ